LGWLGGVSSLTETPKSGAESVEGPWARRTLEVTGRDTGAARGELDWGRETGGIESRSDGNRSQRCMRSPRTWWLRAQGPFSGQRTYRPLGHRQP